MSKLEDLIKDETEDLDMLYFCHTTRLENFEKIIDSGVLQIKHSHFPPKTITEDGNENIVYLFYGIPLFIYKVSSNIMHNSYTNDLPVGILFKPRTMTPLSRFYPFDTGAAFNKMYKSFRHDINTSDDIADYCVNITNDRKPLRQYVKRYFNSNKNYCCCNPTNTDPQNAWEEELIQLHKTNGQNNELDPRAIAIEIHSKHDIIINSDNVEAFIIPRFKSKKYNLIDKIQKTYPDINIIKYCDTGRTSPDMFRQVLIELTINKYIDLKIIEQ